MEFGLDTLIVKIKRVRENEDKKSSITEVKMILEQTEDINVTVNLTNSNSSDIEALFNAIFDLIVDKKKLVELKLEDDEKDLFNEVVVEMINQINGEIIQSREDFEKIIELDHR